MKNILFILVSIIVVSYVACKKTTNGSGEIYGKWKLTETLSDPGDGSGKYTKVKEDSYLTFEKSGLISGEALAGVSSFKIIDVYPSSF